MKTQIQIHIVIYLVRFTPDNFFDSSKIPEFSAQVELHKLTLIILRMVLDIELHKLTLIILRMVLDTELHKLTLIILRIVLVMLSILSRT